jgi:hypothetical protein
MIHSTSLPMAQAPRYRPVQELRIAGNGVLLCATTARYASLDEFIYQFGAPLSCLPGAGWFMFADPICAELRLLVLAVPEPFCDHCHHSLVDCGCAF